ncbi:allantoate permease [Purpureocillium lavendulum]|uniref:Allantoate permease n=1 Tax=Purpureocillium lavendulum TaxID=1247861 RepID=A0AB34FPS1_9HYPO|nr:allantoate permease [Purpureocillium lavendulum]
MFWLLSLLAVWLCGLTSVAEASEVVVRNIPGLSSADTVREIRRRLDSKVKTLNTTVLFDNSTTLDYALNDVKLFEFKANKAIRQRRDGTEVSAGVTITCTKCYIKGIASAKLTAEGSFNGSAVMDDVKNSTKTTFDSIAGYWGNITSVIKGNVKNLTLDEITAEVEQVPPPQINFNVPLDFPGYELQVAFENTEIYVELSTVLSSGLSYSLTLYSSKNLGVDVDLGGELFLGAVFSIDLLLSVENEIEISSGFHIKLDEKVLMSIALFSDKASGVQFKGGKFRFLPVTIQSGNTVLKAVLRLQLRTGFSITPFDPGVEIQIGDLDLSKFKASAGIEASVYANVAEFRTNVTLGNLTSDHKSDSKSAACVLNVVQDYRLVIGAAAGATLGFLGRTYGPTPATEIPIYYTTLGSACLAKSSIATTTAAPVASRAVRRADGEPSTTTKVTEVTYIATACQSVGMINCPASLRTVSKNVVTSTITAAVVSGSSVAWTTTGVTAFATVPFPKDAMSFTGSSGAPKSYVPPPPTTTSGASTNTGSASSTGTGIASLLDGESGGVNKKLIIGLSVGLGLPALIAIVVGGIYFLKRRRESSLQDFSDDTGSHGPDAPGKHHSTRVGYAAVDQDHD